MGVPIYKRTTFLLLVFTQFCYATVSTTAQATRSAKAELILLDVQKYPKARCLDGSPGAFYKNLNPELQFNGTWVIMLQGGGECIDENSCKARSTTALGSSKAMAKNFYFTYGIQDTQHRNPYFNNASYILINYCTGDLHMGAVTKPDSSTFGLYFSGMHIVEAVIDTLMTSSKYNLKDASTIVLAGQSAGGLGIVSLLDRVADKLEASGSTANIVGAPEGGFYFFNDKTYHGENPPPGNLVPWGTTSFPKYYKLWHATVNERCATHYADSPWRCLVANYSFPFIKTRIFITEALTDRVVTRLHAGVPDKAPPFTQDEEVFLKEWATIMKASLKQVMDSPSSGLFAPACWTHTTFDSIWNNKEWAGIMLKNQPRLKYLYNWIHNTNINNFNDEYKNIDPCGVYLCNPTCPPLSSSS
jgi:O-palmitoleoyl-L-serine hydrolase